MVIKLSIPFAGLVYGVSDSIKEGDITPTLEATLAQARLSWLLYLSGQLEKPLTIDKMIETSTEGRKTSGRTTQYERSGGMSQANLDFDSLKPTNIIDLDYGRVGTLADGRQVIVRTKSKDGRPTTEIQKNQSQVKLLLQLNSVMINGRINMEEIYHKKSINYVFGRELFVDKIEYNDHELKIFLDNENIKLQLFFTYIFSFKIIDEGCFIKTLNEQNLTIGLYYSCKSNYLSWFHEQSSNIYLDDPQLKHYVLATQNEIIEIITQWEPDLKIL